MRISARLLKQTLLYTDERAKLEGELLDGVDVVKCMTWEVCMVTHCDTPRVTYHTMSFVSCFLFFYVESLVISDQKHTRRVLLVQVLLKWHLHGHFSAEIAVFFK